MGWIPFYTKREKFIEEAYSFNCLKCGTRTYVHILNNREYTKVECHNCHEAYELIIGNNGIIYQKEVRKCSEENGN